MHLLHREGKENILEGKKEHCRTSRDTYIEQVSNNFHEMHHRDTDAEILHVVRNSFGAHIPYCSK